MKRIEVPDEIMKDADPINDSVQKMADKLKLHRTQVKGILKALYEVPELLNTAMAQAGETLENPDNTENTTPEVRHTRNITKKIAEEGGKVNWVLEKINESDKTPEKKCGRKKKHKEVRIEYRWVTFCGSYCGSQCVGHVFWVTLRGSYLLGHAVWVVIFTPIQR